LLQLLSNEESGRVLRKAAWWSRIAPNFDRPIRLLGDWGQEQKYYEVLKAYNFHIEGLEGAILPVKAPPGSVD
jgi:hypothetical protein